MVGRINNFSKILSFTVRIWLLLCEKICFLISFLIAVFQILILKNPLIIKETFKGFYHPDSSNLVLPHVTTNHNNPLRRKSLSIFW